MINWMYKLQIIEKDINEPIVAIAIADTKGKMEWKKCFEVFQDNNFNGIENVRNEIAELLFDIFNESHGGINGHPFTVWSKNYVIFPTAHGGYEDIAYVKRNPCSEPTDHI